LSGIGGDANAADELRRVLDEELAGSFFLLLVTYREADARVI
jgi:hypothetical protein